MKILFLSLRNCCRSQIAEAILKQIEPDLEIYSAGIEPASEINPIVFEIMKEAGIPVIEKKPSALTEIAGLEFDYLITVGDSTIEEFKLPPLKYKQKIHLGFHNPFKNQKDIHKIKESCREIRDEIMVELDYFSHHYIQPTKTR